MDLALTKLFLNRKRQTTNTYCVDMVRAREILSLRQQGALAGR